MSQRINYNQIAHRYDADRLRGRSVDADLLAFLETRPDHASPATILDIGCGTGNQLVANRKEIEEGQMVGLDLFEGMLRQGQRKVTGQATARRIDWVQGDGAALSFREQTFDFISNQTVFHHVQDKPGMLAEVWRVLRPGGRFVMINISVREMPSWIIYRYFPGAWGIDLVDFLPKEALESLMKAAGFAEVRSELDHWEYEEDLAEFLQVVQGRVVSQLVALPDADYEAGLRQIEAELAQTKGGTILIPSEVCMLKITGERS